ncbi:uncharacterized protein [Nicotiana tomentosiformis]|uniref:uncharacterized protein n=1 Tax=Nicotiana tomentosiformis TaxID=4098 RepID=UPI00388CA067
MHSILDTHGVAFALIDPKPTEATSIQMDQWVHANKMARIRTPSSAGHGAGRGTNRVEKENKGCDEREASDLRKKAKIGGSFSGGFDENRRAGSQGQQQQGSQTGTHLSSQSTYKPHYRQGTRGPSSSGHRNSGKIYATTPVCQTCGAIGIGNKGRGAGDRATVNQGHGNTGRGQARVFAFTRQDAQASNVVVTSILSVCSFDALALIDPGSTHSYVSSYFILRFSRQPELLNDPFLVSTPVGESLLAEYVYRACQIQVEGRDTLADLILSSCYAIVDCHAKLVKFEIPNEPSFVLKGGQVPETYKVVSFMKAQRLLKKGCLGLLAIVNDTRKETVSIENVPIVREFSDVFPEDLPGLPPV